MIAFIHFSVFSFSIAFLCSGDGVGGAAFDVSALVQL